MAVPFRTLAPPRAPGKVGLRVQAVTSLEELEAIGPLWQALHEETDLPPYYGFEWFRDAVALTPEPDNVSFCICVLHDSEGPAGIVPLQIVRQLFVTRMSFLATGQPVSNTCVLTPRLRGREPLKTACEWIRRNHCRWDYCSFDKVMEGSQLHEELSVVSSPDDVWRIEEQPIDPNVRIELTGSWEEFLPTVSAKHRRNIYQQTRKLGRLGRVRFERIGLDRQTEAARLERVMEDALAVCRVSWQGSSDRGRTICDDDQIDFYRAVCRDCAAKGWLDLSVLYVDDRPVSFIWGMTRAPVANIATLAFDPGLKPLSPGLVHMARYVQDSIDRGFTAIDFGHEFGDYKRRWSKVTQPLFDYTYYAHPRWSRLRRRLQNRWQGSIGRRLKKLRGLLPGRHGRR